MLYALLQIAMDQPWPVNHDLLSTITMVAMDGDFPAIRDRRNRSLGED
jgi:hypothetical protein